MPHSKWENGIKRVATVIKGAQTQVKAYNELTVAGTDLLVYGVLDALKAGTIFDVKFINKSFGSAELAGKYLDCSQHPAYFYIVPEAQKFVYLVSDGEDLYTETYTPHNSRPFAEIAKEFLDLAFVNRTPEKQLRIALSVIKFAADEIRLLDERIAILDESPASRHHPKRPVAAPLRNAVRKGEREKHTFCICRVEVENWENVGVGGYCRVGRESWEIRA